jgi:hypothetical protein
MLTQSWSFVQVNKAPRLARINRDVRHRAKMAIAGTPILRKADGLVLRADKKGKMRLIEVND